MSNASAAAHINRYGLLVRCLVILVCAGVLNSTSVFVSPLAESLNIEVDKIANVSTTMLTFWAIGALIGGWLMSKLGAKKTLFLGCLMFGLGMIFSSFVPSSALWLLYITMSFMQGVGNGVAYTVATYVATSWFPDKRGLASGLCMACHGGSSAFLAPLCSFLTDVTSINVTLLAFGAGCCIICILCAVKIIQAPLGYIPAGYVESKVKGADADLESLNAKQAMKHRPIWHLAIAVGFFPTMYMIMFPRLSVFITDAGFALTVATVGVSVYNVANVLGRLILGALCDKIHYKHVYGICGVLCVLSCIILMNANTVPMFYIGYILLGVGFGATNSVYPVAINKSYGPMYAGNIYGIMMMGYMIICTQITPRVSSALVAKTGGYTASFTYAIILTCLAVISMYLIPKVKRNRIAESELKHM